MNDMEIKKLKCKRCGYSWYPRIIGDITLKPFHCASCNSPYWDRVKVKFR